MPAFTVRSLLPVFLIALLGSTVLPVQAENIPLTHPTVELVKQYFRHVVNEDWKAAAGMLKPASIERKKRRMVELIKRTRTITEETEMLARLGVKDIREVEAMSVEDFYAAERKGLSGERNDSATEAIRKQKQESLKVNVLGIIGENKNTIVHLAVRTSQHVLDQQIDELIFLSFEQDAEDSKKWYIVPDMQLPVSTPLKAADAAAGEKK